MGWALNRVSIGRDIEIVQTVCETIGEDRDILIDVQNCWYEVGQAIASIRAIGVSRTTSFATTSSAGLADYAFTSCDWY